MDWSTAISLGSSVLGGLFGGGGRSRTDYFNQMKAEGEIGIRNAEAAAKRLPKAQVAGFKAAGIHPLYGMSGGSAQYSPSFSGSPIDDGTPSVGQRISEMGQNISRAAEAYAGKDERELNKRILEAQLKGLELENVARASNIMLKNQAGTPPGLPPSGYKDDILGPGPSPAMKEVVMPNGQRVRVWDENSAGDNELGSAASTVGFTVPDFLKESVRLYFNKHGTKLGKRLFGG